MQNKNVDELNEIKIILQQILITLNKENNTIIYPRTRVLGARVKPLGIRRVV